MFFRFGDKAKKGLRISLGFAAGIEKSNIVIHA
jgi:hypothetical protein